MVNVLYNVNVHNRQTDKFTNGNYEMLVNVQNLLQISILELSPTIKQFVKKYDTGLFLPSFYVLFGKMTGDLCNSLILGTCKISSIQ